MASTAEEQVFTARDVQVAAGLTGRQLNDWDGRGALPHTREGIGWRRFSARQLFTLMVGTELRRRFGVSVERLKFVMELMNDIDGADHFEFAIYLMCSVGGGVWLMTDFGHTFLIDSELKFSELWGNGYFGAENPTAYAFLKVNPIVNSILGSAENPIHLSSERSNLLSNYRSQFGVESAEEYDVLQMIRSGEYERIEVVAPNGKIETIKTTKKPDVTERLQDLLRNHEFQKLTVTQKDGRILNIEQQVTIKPSNGDSKK